MLAAAAAVALAVAATSPPASSSTAAAATPAPPAAATKPSAAPAITFDKVSDKTFVDTILKPRKGRVTLVNFWASYCLPCLEEIPALLALREKYAKSADIVFVATDAPDSTDLVARVLAKRSVKLTRSFIVENEDPEPFIRLIDSAWQGEMPFTVVYGVDGTPATKLVGAQTAATFETALKAVIGASGQ